MLVTLALVGAFAGRAIQDGPTPRLAFSSTSAAYGVGQAGLAAEASATARVTKDLPVLLQLWDVSSGPPVKVHYVEAPGGIRAGEPLRVTVHGYQPNGLPFAGAIVEVSWRFGNASYRDVTQTDSNGDVDMSRRVDDGGRGKECFVAIRMYRDDLQGMAYTSFIAR